MRHLRRSSRHNDKVGTGKRVLDGKLQVSSGEEALVGAPRPWKPTPIRPSLPNLQHSPLGKEFV